MGRDSAEEGGGSRAGGLVLKALVLLGGALLLKKLRKSKTRWDHARVVAEALSGEKVCLFLCFCFHSYDLFLKINK